MVNAGIPWQSEDRLWEVAFDIKNLIDRRVSVQGFNLAVFCGCNEVSYKPLRFFSMPLRRNF